MSERINWLINKLITWRFSENLRCSEAIWQHNDSPCFFLRQWREAQRSWSDLSHQWPAPGPDGDPPAGDRHPAECLREGAAHGGKRTNPSPAQSCRVPHTLRCKYTVSQLQRGIETFSLKHHKWKRRTIKHLHCEASLILLSVWLYKYNRSCSKVHLFFTRA